MKKSHNDLEIFGQNVRFARRQMNLSLEDVASRVGTHQPKLSRIENGKGNPTLETCAQLADVLDAPLFELFDPKYISRCLESPRS